MFIVDTTDKKIIAYMGEAAATLNPTFMSSYADHTNLSFTEGSAVGSLNDTTDVDILPSPASDAPRICKSIQIFNCDSYAHNITIAYSSGGTEIILNTFNLDAGALYTTNGVTENFSSPSYIPAISGWKSIAVLYTDINAIAATNTQIQIQNMAINQMFNDAMIQTITEFRGGAISAITAAPMNAGNGIATGVDIYAVGSDTAFARVAWQSNRKQLNRGAAWDAKLYIVATGANLNALTSGSMVFHYRTTYFPAT